MDPVRELLASDQRMERVPADRAFAVRILDDVCDQECTLAMLGLPPRLELVPTKQNIEGFAANGL